MDTTGHPQGQLRVTGEANTHGSHSAGVVPVAAAPPGAHVQATGLASSQGQLQAQLHAAQQQVRGRTLWPAPHVAPVDPGAPGSRPPGAAAGMPIPLQQQQRSAHVNSRGQGPITHAGPYPPHQPAGAQQQQQLLHGTSGVPAVAAPATLAAAAAAGAAAAAQSVPVETAGAATTAAHAARASTAAAGTSDTTYHVQRMSHKQLMAAAAAHNLSAIGTQDPIADTLRGVDEVANLRPGTQPAVSFTLGTVSADSPYFKAWKGVRRSLRAAAAGTAAPSAPLVFRVSSAKAGMRGSSSEAAPVAGAAAGPPRNSQARATLTPEQQRWVDKLSAFLGRPAKVPRLGAGLPVLDLRALWLEVMALGGCKAAADAGAWSAIADKLQHDAGRALLLQQVYDAYLQPLEAELPPGFRPARALDLIEGRVQQRASAAARLGSVTGVQHAAAQAEAALSAWEQRQQQQQQQSAVADHAGQQAAAGSTAGASVAAGAGSEGACGTVDDAAEQEPRAAAAGGPQQAEGLGGNLAHAVWRAAALLQEAALFPAEVVQSVCSWGLLPSFCPDRLEACKKAHSTARTARRRSARDSGRGPSGSEGDAASSSSEGAHRPGSSSSSSSSSDSSGSEVDEVHNLMSDSDDEPAQQAPSRLVSDGEDSFRAGGHNQQPAAGHGPAAEAPGGELQLTRKPQPRRLSALSDSDEEEAAMPQGSGRSPVEGGNDASEAAVVAAVNATGDKRMRSSESAGGSGGHNQQQQQQQQQSRQEAQQQPAPWRCSSPSSKRPRFQSITLVRPEPGSPGAVDASMAPAIPLDSQRRQEQDMPNGAEQQQQQQQECQQQDEQELVEAVAGNSAGNAGEVAAEDGGNRVGYSNQQPASSTSTGAGVRSPSRLGVPPSTAPAAAAAAHRARQRSSKGSKGGAPGNLLPEEAVAWHAARWLLLVRRALGAGPPGCEKRPPLAQPIERPPKGVASVAGEGGRAAAAAQQRRTQQFGQVEERAGFKRTYKGITPKCGRCHTCKHPQMKKACLTNRDRLAQGLPPILPSA